jgi:hypothetical protein
MLSKGTKGLGKIPALFLLCNLNNCAIISLARLWIPNISQIEQKYDHEIHGMIRFLIYFVAAAIGQSFFLIISNYSGVGDWFAYSFYDIPTILLWELLWGPHRSGTKIDVSAFDLVIMPLLFYSLILALLISGIRLLIVQRSKT